MELLRNKVTKEQQNINTNKKLNRTRGISHGWVCADSTQSNLIPTFVTVGHSDSRLIATTSYHHL